MGREEQKLSDFQQRARDLAAAYDIPLVEAVLRLQREVAVSPVSPIFGVTYPKWWKRLIPGWRLRWQRSALDDLSGIDGYGGVADE